jgi:hypothetical protein
VEYAALIVLLGIFIHTLSFARFNWRKNNKKATAGAVILAFISAAFPVYMLFFRS